MAVSSPDRILPRRPPRPKRFSSSSCGKRPRFQSTWLCSFVIEIAYRRRLAPQLLKEKTVSQLMTEPTSGQQWKQARPAVERIAAFAAAARPGQLTPDIRQLYKRNILDSLGCAIAALPGPPFKALRDQFDE